MCDNAIKEIKAGLRKEVLWREQTVHEDLYEEQTFEMGLERCEASHVASRKVCRAKGEPWTG